METVEEHHFPPGPDGVELGPVETHRQRQEPRRRSTAVVKPRPPRPKKIAWDDASLLDEDKKTNVKVFEYQDGSTEWECSDFYFPTPDSAKALEVPPTLRTRLYLVEGLSPELMSQLFAIPLTIDKSFFRYHTLNGLPYDPSTTSLPSSSSFFAKWSRCVLQCPKHRAAEHKIAQGRPWDSNLFTDPRDIGLDHERFDKPRSIPRPCDPMEPNPGAEEGQYIRMSLGECVSYHFERVGSADIGT
jgi:hypothetical protein